MTSLPVAHRDGTSYSRFGVVRNPKRGYTGNSVEDDMPSTWAHDGSWWARVRSQDRTTVALQTDVPGRSKEEREVTLQRVEQWKARWGWQGVEGVAEGVEAACEQEHVSDEESEACTWCRLGRHTVLWEISLVTLWGVPGGARARPKMRTSIYGLVTWADIQEALTKTAEAAYKTLADGCPLAAVRMEGYVRLGGIKKVVVHSVDLSDLCVLGGERVLETEAIKVMLDTKRIALSEIERRAGRRVESYA